MSYIVPVHRSSGVRLGLKLNFLDPHTETIVVAKANRLEFYNFDPESGVTLVHSRAVYGYVIMLDAIRPQSSPTDHIFVGTDRYQYFTCSWDAEAKQLKTEQSYVDQADKTLRNSRDNDRVHIDPTRRFMSLELHDGIVTVVPIIQQSNKKVRRSSSATAADVPGSLGEPIQVRIEEMAIRSTAFVDVDEENSDTPRLAILWEDNSDQPQLKIRELRYSSSAEQPAAELETVAELKNTELDSGVSHLIPVPAPYSGFLILAERSISYVDANLVNIRTERLEEQATLWNSWTKVDDHRWLLADDYGKLYFLMLVIHDGSTTLSWRVDYLGQASRASCLIYLDAGVAFLGSHAGDSQLIRIREQGVEVLQTFSNIAPILDFELMDLGRGGESAAQTGEFSSGQARLVTASGAWQDATIRTVRSGVGVEEIGDLGETPLITDMWALSSQGAHSPCDALLMSLVEETKVLKFDSDGSIEEVVDFYNLDLSAPTILAANLPDRKLLHVNEKLVQISDLESGMTVFEWTPADAAAKITGATANGAHILIIENGVSLHVFHSSGQGSGTSVSKTFSVDSQISSVSTSETQGNVCIVAFPQKAEVAMLDIHSLETLNTQSLGSPGSDVPRSVLVANIMPDAFPTLFIAMADGTVNTFTLDTNKKVLSGMSKILLGTQPVFLKTLPRATLSSPNLVTVFASCEQPSLIYSSEGRLIYSAVNSDFAARVCSFDSEAFPGAIAIASENELKLANIDNTRTTQIHTLNIGETVRCISYQPEFKLFAMGCIKRTLEVDDGVPRERLSSSVKVADEVTFKEIDSFALDEMELVECITPLVHPSISDDQEMDEENCLFIVGTSVAPESEDQDERGRIIVFSFDSRNPRLNVLAETRLKTACRSLAVADGFIVAGLLKLVVLFSFVTNPSRGDRYSHKLNRLASYRTSTDPLSMSIQPAVGSRPTTVAVGDLMKSLSILTIEKHDSGKWHLLEQARHFATLWTSAVAAVAESEWVIADVEGNLSVLRQNADAYGDEARRLEMIGEMRLGEVVNKIVPIGLGSTTTVSENAKGKGRQGSSTLSRTATRGSVSQEVVGPLVRPQAFIATIEGSIYMLGAINPAYTDALIRLQNALANRVLSPGYMPWAKYRAWRSEVRESDEPFRFVDGEMVEQGLLNLPDVVLNEVLKETGLNLDVTDGGIGLSLEHIRAWGEELRRLY